MKHLHTVLLLLALHLSAFSALADKGRKAPEDDRNDPVAVPIGKEIAKSGWNIGVLPAFTYNNDLGFLVGAMAQVFDYGDGSVYPNYRHKFTANLNFYTRGAKQIALNYDSKYLIPDMRVTAGLEYMDNPLCGFYGYNGAVSPYHAHLDLQKSADGTDGVAFYADHQRLLRATLDLQGRIADGLTVQDYLGFGISLSQLVMMSVLQLVTTFVALAIGMSDEWRVAAFRYNEAEKKNRTLARDVADLRGQVDALKRPASEQQDSISVKIDLMKRRLPLDDILYVQSDGDYIVLHLSDGSAPMVLMTLKSLERQLPFDRFCRIHRSYLVNVDKVGGLKGGKVSVAGDQLPLSDSCKARFLEILSHKSLVLKAE